MRNRDLAKLVAGTMLAIAPSILAASAQPLPPTSPPQLAPVLPPAYVVDLLTADGMAAFGAQWKHMDVKIVEGPALPNAMPGYKTSYDITPHAGVKGFDDSSWPTLEPKQLLDRRGGWLVASENAPGVDAPEAIQVCNSASVARQSACRGKRTKLIDRGHRVAEREHRELLAPAVEEWIAPDNEPAGLQWDQVCEGRINVASATRVQDMELPPQRAGRLLQLSRLDIATGKSRVDERGYCASVEEQLVQQLQALPIRFRTQRGHTCEVTARSVQAGYETDLNRIGAGDKNNGDRGGFSLGRYRRLAVRDNHAHLTANQIGCQCRQ